LIGGANSSSGAGGDVEISSGGAATGAPGDIEIFAGGASAGVADGGDVITRTGATFGGLPGAVILGDTAGQNAHLVTTGVAPGAEFSVAGSINAASTDTCGVIIALTAAGGTAAITFHPAYPASSTVVVVCSYGTTPTVGADAPFVTAISTTGFTLTNPDGVKVNDIHYMVMGCI